MARNYVIKDGEIEDQTVLSKVWGRCFHGARYLLLDVFGFLGETHKELHDFLPWKGAH